MDQRIKNLIDETRDKFGLTSYHLHQWEIRRYTTIFNETVYTVSMEWFPNHIKDWDESYNPEGTACMEIDLHCKKLKSISFVSEKSYANSIKFDLQHKHEIIHWIEKETNLQYGEQFALWKEEERTLYFKPWIDGIEVALADFMELKLDQEGNLIFFSAFASFSSKKVVKQEKYTLSLEQIEPLVKQQIMLIEIPDMMQKKHLPVYAIEEIYIKNDGSSTLPFLVDAKNYMQINQVIEWNQPQIQAPFHKKKIDFDENVTFEQALLCEPHPDLQPITAEEAKKCIHATQKFLSQVYAHDSGKWELKSLHREHGYIHATLTRKEQKVRVFKRKLILFLDPNTYEVLNFIDSEKLLDEMFAELKEAEEIKVTKEEAFEKLKSSIQLTPYYVYDDQQDKYVLCGKLDCDYAVQANNGEIVAF